MVNAAVLHPHVRVTFAPGVRSDLLWRAEIRTMVGNHEIAFLDFRHRAGEVAPPEGSQVVVTFGANPKWSKTFYGYVNHAERIDDASPKAANSYRVVCVGTSKPMNAPHTGRWAGVTDSFIARTLAERYRLRSVMGKSTQMIDWVQGSQETDFTMLKRLAAQCGRLFWVSGPTLYFVDPAHRIVTAASGSVQTFTRTFPATSQMTDTLNSMYLIRGADAPGLGNSVQTAYGLDPYTGALIKGSSAKAYTDAGLKVPGTTSIFPGSIASGAEAEAVTSAGIFAGTWAQMQADVWVKDAPVNVGDVVNLDGTGVNSVDQGLWFVSGTLEVMTYLSGSHGYDYSANLTLTRNQSGNHVTRSTKNLTGAPPVRPAVWNGKAWQSQTLESIYV